MTPSSMAIELLSASPAVGRTVLRSWLRLVGEAPIGKHWVAESLKRRLTAAKSERRETLPGGLVIDVDLASSIGREIYFHRTSDAGILKFLRRVLKPGMRAIDAGANIGEFTLHAAHLVGMQGRVVAIEASPVTVQRLVHNVALNHLPQIHVIEAAVCGDEHPRTFHLGSGSDSGSSSLTPPHDDEGRVVTVSGVRLDRVVANYLSGQVDLIKLDVEGAELAALEGGRSLLTGQHRPTVVLEYHVEVARRSGWQLVDLHDFFRGFAYDLKALTDSGRLEEVTAPTQLVTDLVAFPRVSHASRTSVSET